MPGRRLLWGLAFAALVSLAFALQLPPLWQLLPVGMAGTLLVLAAGARQGFAASAWGLWERPMEVHDNALPWPPELANGPVQLLVDCYACSASERQAWYQRRTQLLRLIMQREPAIEVSLYILTPELQWCATGSAVAPTLANLRPSASPGDLGVALDRLCRQTPTDGSILIMAPLGDTTLARVQRLELTRRGLRLGLMDSRRQVAHAPTSIRNWRMAQAYAQRYECEQDQALLALRLRRKGIHWL